MSMADGNRPLRRPGPDARAARDEMAAGLVRSMLVQVDRFTEADAGLSQEDLLRMSIGDHWAWAIRFLPDSANLATLARLYVQHGYPVPGCLKQDSDFDGVA